MKVIIRNWEAVECLLTFTGRELWFQKISCMKDFSISVFDEKNLFQKRSTPQWSEEVFMIAKFYIMYPITYTLEDSCGEPLEGTFC